MALFGSKKKTETAAKPAAKAAVAAGARSFAGVLRHARITEKATMHQGASIYTFDVAESATKQEIKQAVKAIYGVSPRKVAVVSVPSKTKCNARTGRKGVKQGGRKAYVYLKSGETITIA